jgi:hypothetical protein
VIDAVDFRTGVDVWFVHGSLPGRLVRPLKLLRCSLTAVLAESGLTTYGDKRASKNSNRTGASRG